MGDPATVCEAHPGGVRRWRRAPPGRWRGRIAVCAGVLAAGALLRLITGIGFANYDTLYALLWGQQLTHGQTPQYGIQVAPTPHPLLEALGLLTAPLGPKAMEGVAVWLGFAALAGCAWVLYRLTERWLGRAAGVLAGLILLTRVPIISYGVRAYIDVPYLFLVLAAALRESRRPRSGAPVLALLALAGLLRPEAWVLSGLYWLYLCLSEHRRGSLRAARPRLAVLAILALSAPLVWVLSDLAITGDPLWSFTNTRHTAAALHRKTGIADVPEYVPRRIGEILGPSVLAGAGLGGLCSLLWLRERTVKLAVLGFSAVAIFIAFSTAGLPINTRYAFLSSAILCSFCGAGVFGWRYLPAGDRRRGWWMAASCALAIALIAYAPSQYSALQAQLSVLGRHQRYQDELAALVERGAISVRCEPIGVPNHEPIPLLALYLGTRPSEIVSAVVREIHAGTYLETATKAAREEYILGAHDPERVPAAPPSGFRRAHSDRSWLVYERCP